MPVAGLLLPRLRAGERGAGHEDVLEHAARRAPRRAAARRRRPRRRAPSAARRSSSGRSAARPASGTPATGRPSADLARGPVGVELDAARGEAAGGEHDPVRAVEAPRAARPARAPRRRGRRSRSAPTTTLLRTTRPPARRSALAQDREDADARARTAAASGSRTPAARARARAPPRPRAASAIPSTAGNADPLAAAQPRPTSWAISVGAEARRRRTRALGQRVDVGAARRAAGRARRARLDARRARSVVGQRAPGGSPSARGSPTTQHRPAAAQVAAGHRLRHHAPRARRRRRRSAAAGSRPARRRRRRAQRAVRDPALEPVDRRARPRRRRRGAYGCWRRQAAQRLERALDPRRARSRGRRSSRARDASRRRPWPARARARRPPRAGPPRSAPRARRRRRRRRGGSCRRPPRPRRFAASASGQVLDVEQALEDPVVEPRLAQLVAVEDRPHALPALLRGSGSATSAACSPSSRPTRVQDPRRPVDAEAALARAHAEPQAAPDVVEVVRAAPAHRLLEPRAADQLALADQLLVLLGAPRAARSREPIEYGSAVLVPGRLHLGRACRAAGRRAGRTSRRRCPGPSAAASSACRPTWSAGRVTPSRVAWSTTACVRLTSRVSVACSALRVLEQRPHAGPDAQRARLAEARAPAARRRRASGRPPPA